MTIRVSGQAQLTVDFAVDLDMNQKQFNALSHKKQDELIKIHTQWSRASFSEQIYIDDHIDVVSVNE